MCSVVVMIMHWWLSCCVMVCSWYCYQKKPDVVFFLQPFLSRQNVRHKRSANLAYTSFTIRVDAYTRMILSQLCTYLLAFPLHLYTHGSRFLYNVIFRNYDAGNDANQHSYDLMYFF